MINCLHAVIPSSYITVDAQTVSVSGSSVTGHCSNVSSNGVISTCTDPTSSVLFDGVIPTLTGLDGDMWASQLLTLQTTATRATVLFDFTDTPSYVGLLGRLEVVMFNCPEKGILASTIRVSTSSSPSENTTPLMVVNIDITSCDFLVRVCTPITTTQPSITLEFVITLNSDMVYLAEMTFYADTSASTCPPDSIVTTDDTTTTTPNTTTFNTPPPNTPNTTTFNTPPPNTPNTTTFNTPPPNTTSAMESSITSIIVPVVVVICMVFMIVGIMAAVFIGWKYKTSHHTALGEGHSIHSHPPPVPPHQYKVGKKAAKKDTLPPLDKERSGVHSSEADIERDQLYAQVDENLKEEVSIYTSPLTSKVNTPAGIVHAQANKGKKKGEVAAHSIRKKLTQK